MAKKKRSFLKDTMSGANGKWSSKRVLGSVILVVLLVVIVINTFYGNQNAWMGEAFITMLIGAFSLLGVGVFERRFDSGDSGRKSSRRSSQTDEPDYENEEDQCT